MVDSATELTDNITRTLSAGIDFWIQGDFWLLKAVWGQKKPAVSSNPGSGSCAGRFAHFSRCRLPMQLGSYHSSASQDKSQYLKFTQRVLYWREAEEWSLT